MMRETTYYDVELTVTGKQEVTFYDVVANVPVANVDYSSLSINIGANTLSDSFRMTTPSYKAKLDDLLKGELYGWKWDFTVDSITKRNGQEEYNGRYNANKLQRSFYQVIRRAVAQTVPDTLSVSAKSIVQDMAERMGLTLIYNAMDWLYPLPKLSEEDASEGYKRAYYGISGTYAGVISQLFGWLSMLPNIGFSVTIRNGYLIVTQRGHETKSYAVQTVEYPPTVTINRIYTEWAGSGNETEKVYEPEQETQTPYSGTISFGDSSLTYVDGLLTTEIRGLTTTEYSYTKIDEQDYLDHKESVTLDDAGLTTGTCSRTEYAYAKIKEEVYLQRETEYTDGDYDGGVKNYTDAVKRTVTHSPLQNGFYGTTVYDNDGEVISTSLSQGAPSNTVSKFMVDIAQEILTRNEMYEDVVNLIKYLACPTVSTSYPVTDRAVIKSLVDATDWLNGRIEETVTLTTVDRHIIDTTETVIYNGNTYYVDSNNIVHSAENGIRQSLTLKRWY